MSGVRTARACTSYSNVSSCVSSNSRTPSSATGGPQPKTPSSARSSRSAARKLRSCALIRSALSAASPPWVCQVPRALFRRFSGVSSTNAFSKLRRSCWVLTANCLGATRVLSTTGSGRTPTCERAEIPSKPALPKCNETSLDISFYACSEAIKGYAMQFCMNESQEFLKHSARKFDAGECPSTEMRRLMETDTAYDAALWSKLTDQGYTGIIFPEAYGGVGLGKVELMLLMEEAGRALLPGPLFSTVVLAGSVLEAVSTPANKKKYLAPICRGEARATVAILEASASWNPRDVHMSATNGKLSGEKFFVSDAAIADFIIVAARNGVLVVDSKARGLKISPMSAMDLTRKLYVVEFNNTPAEELVSNSN